jgi:hypothetical protein
MKLEEHIGIEAVRAIVEEIDRQIESKTEDVKKETDKRGSVTRMMEWAGRDLVRTELEIKELNNLKKLFVAQEKIAPSQIVERLELLNREIERHLINNRFTANSTCPFSNAVNLAKADAYSNMAGHFFRDQFFRIKWILNDKFGIELPEANEL